MSSLKQEVCVATWQIEQWQRIQKRILAPLEKLQSNCSGVLINTLEKVYLFSFITETLAHCLICYILYKNSKSTCFIIRKCESLFSILFCGLLKDPEYKLSPKFYYSYVNRVDSTGQIFFYILPRTPFGEGNGNPLQYSCQEKPVGGGAWWGVVSQSQTRLR